MPPLRTKHHYLQRSMTLFKPQHSRQGISYSHVPGVRSLFLAALSVIISLSSFTAIADCIEEIGKLDGSYASAGYMISDDAAVTTSGYLEQSRTLRDSAMILLSNGREDECVDLIRQAQQLADRASRPSVFSAEELAGREVRDPSGQLVGEIANVMVDLDRGVVAYALIAFGGFLGIGEDLVPVPFGKLSQSENSEALEISASFQQVENAPRYIEGDWDLLSRRSWAVDVYNYYGADPYWTDRRVRGKSSMATRAGLQEPDSTESTAIVGDTEGSKSEDNGKAVEAHPPLRGFDHVFSVLDTNEDDTLSLDEARREFAAFKSFLSLDGDESGSLTRNEFMAIKANHRISLDGETIIPNAGDAKPEEKWTGGKEQTEAAAN